jgi:hypothetical protein
MKLPDPKKIAQFSNETLMPLGLVITVVFGVIWITTGISDINHKLQTIESKLVEQWTRRDMENWALKLKLKNSALDVPEVPSK